MCCIVLHAGPGACRQGNGWGTCRGKRVQHKQRAFISESHYTGSKEACLCRWLHLQQHHTVAASAVLYRHVLLNCWCLPTHPVVTNRMQPLAPCTSHRMRSTLCWWPPGASGCRCEPHAQTLWLTHAGRQAGGNNGQLLLWMQTPCFAKGCSVQV